MFCLGNLYLVCTGGGVSFPFEADLEPILAIPLMQIIDSWEDASAQRKESLQHEVVASGVKAVQDDSIHNVG